jgi:glycosyltransferase involved in cell wall biosynthesis
MSWITALLAHDVIVVSNHDLLLAQKMPFVGHKTTRIYNGIKADALGPGLEIRNAFPPNIHITGTVGELTKNKNQASLVEQAKNDPALHIAIVGEGEERPHLEALITKYQLENRVKLFGFMPAHTVLKGFDTFALPSLKEGLPYVLLEAKAAGLPIVANRIGGVPEVLDAKDMSEFSLEHMVERTKKIYLS